jgi:hypothetical protein
MGTVPRRILNSQTALRSPWRKEPQPRPGWPHRMVNNGDIGKEDNPVSAGKSER